MVASESTCQTWRTRDWPSSGKLLTIDALERELGDRLRLPQYAHRFTQVDAPSMAEVLLESQPSVVVTALLLRQWHVKYHPDSGPKPIETADALEEYAGDEIRREYAYSNSRALHGVLMKRRPPVLFGHQVVRTWLETYAPRRIAAKRTAPAVWETAGEPLAKRPAVCAAMVELMGAAALEDACSERYRRAVTDEGLGICLP